MTKNKLSLLMIAFLMTFAVTGTVYANPSYFAPTQQTNIATSSPAVMTPGTATSTVSMDTRYGNNQFKASSAGLAIQFAGVSPSAVINISFEYSQDGIDWYKSYVTDPNAVSTSSPSYTVQVANSISWKFASTTVNGAGVTAANSATSTGFFIVPTPTRYVRAVISDTGANASVWAQFVPIKELQ